MENTVYALILGILSERLGTDPSQVCESSRLIEDIGANSLDLVIMLSEAEDRLGISITDEELLGMKTVGAAALKLAEYSGLPSGISEDFAQGDEDNENEGKD